jgi:hypothetical protein
MERPAKTVPVIKLVEASELPAICAECDGFMDDLCVQFPAAYDIRRRRYLCKECAGFLSPAISSALAIVCTGVLYAYYEAVSAPETGAQLDLLRYGCRNLLNSHFATFFGKPEPDYYLTSTALH